MIRIIFILGLAFADKLDRTYLPPPGSEFSGGNLDALDIPLEQPKLHYTSKDVNLKSPQIAIGIDRLGPQGVLDTFQNKYSTLNPSTYSENTFVTPATSNYFTKDVYSTTNPDSSHYSHDPQNFLNPKDSPQIYNQPEYDSVFHGDKFQTTENYPQLIQGVVSRKDSPYGLIPNKVNSQVNIGDTVRVDILEPSLTSTYSLINSIPNKYNPDLIPTSPIPVQEYVTSTLSPSINYSHSSTEKPKQFYLGTPVTPELSTNTPRRFTTRRPERIQAQADREASILNYGNSITSDGYAYNFDTSNGIHGDENGIINDGTKAKGSYSYIGDDGKLYSVRYTADENGFQPQGEHLPTSPPVPDAILKVIEQVAKEKEAGIFDDGSYDENKYGYKKYHNGFNSPKTDFSIRKHSSSDENGLIKNQNPNKTANKSIENHSIDKKPEHENGIYQDGDLETSDEETNRSPSFFVNSISEKTQMEDTHLPTTIKVGKYNDFTQEQNRPNEGYSKESHEESGYQYNPPHYRGLNKFPSRFSDTNNIKIERQNERNRNRVPLKPFLTPYAFEHKDILKNDNINGKPFVNAEGEYEEEEINHNNNSEDGDNYPIHDEGYVNRENVFNRTEVSDYQPDKGIIGQNNQFIDYNPHTIDEGYTYEQGVSDPDRKTYDSLVSISPKAYSPSTEIPYEFTTRLTTIQDQYPKVSDAIPQTITGQKTVVYSTTSTALPNVYLTNTDVNKTNNPYDYSSKGPGFLNQYDKSLEQNSAITGYPKTEIELSNTTPTLEFSTNIPTIGNSYAPNIDIVYTDKSTTEPNIGEDFRGPNQPQRFDSITGYYY